MVYDQNQQELLSELILSAPYNPYYPANICTLASIMHCCTDLFTVLFPIHLRVGTVPETALSHSTVIHGRHFINVF